MTTCQNCGEQIGDSYKFCPYCGQKKDEKLTLKVLFNHTINNYFSVDARFFRSFFPLLVKPGFLPKRFVEGKRLTYLHPAQTYLFISVIFFFIFSFVTREQERQVDALLKSGFETDNERLTENRSIPADTAEWEKELRNKKVDTTVQMGVFTYKKTSSDTLTSNGTEGGTMNFNLLGTKINMDLNVVDSLIAAKAPNKEIYKAMGMTDDATAFDRKVYEQTLKIYKRKGSGVLQAFYDTIPITMFFLLPVFAMILKLFYYRKGPFSHHLVFSFYYFSFLFFVFGILIGLGLIWEIPAWIINLVLFSTFLYLILGTRNFYGQGYLLSIFKSGLAATLFFVLVIPFTVLIMFLVAFLFY